MLDVGCWIVVMLLAMPATGMACPGCKESLVDPSELGQRLATAKGYAFSIGLLLAVPVGLVSALTLAIVRAHRRKVPGNFPARPRWKSAWHR